MFASLTDIQAWLQSDKIQVDDANSKKSNIEATRIIKGALAGMFQPIVIASWVDPNTTPEIIRSVAGRLTAAFIHATVYSEESDRQISAYSQWLYDGAIMLLSQIVSGTITVVDGNGDPVNTEGSGLLSFFPDDTTTPMFTIGQTFN